MKKYLFVGLKPSQLAWKTHRTWWSKGLAAKPLWDAFDKLQIFIEQVNFVNLYLYPDDNEVHDYIIEYIRCQKVLGINIIALGRDVEKVLKKYKIKYIFLVHPAARGRVRKRELYIELVRKALR